MTPALELSGITVRFLSKESGYPYQLSGGMRKRTALAQVLALDPDIILMDEPFRALDIQTRQLLENEVLVLGLWLALAPTASAILGPHIKVANSMPRVILAPIFAMWFGLGIWSKLALAVTLVFFIAFFNVYQGVKEALS